MDTVYITSKISVYRRSVKSSCSRETVAESFLGSVLTPWGAPVHFNYQYVNYTLCVFRNSDSECSRERQFVTR